jgi:hypothetical protein
LPDLARSMQSTTLTFPYGEIRAKAERPRSLQRPSLSGSGLIVRLLAGE